MTPTEFPVSSQPDISVVVPCYNAARWLEPLFDSLQSQQFTNWEILFVDDGSTDETARVIDELCAREPRARALHTKRGGAARARNIGARACASSSRFLFFLDADDCLKPDALRRLRNYLERHSDVGLIGCQFDEIDEDGQFLQVSHRSRWVPGRFIPRTLRPSEYPTPFVTFYCVTGQGPFALYRRKVWEQTAGWDENLPYAEDADMFCQMALVAPVHYLPARLYQKRVHPNQAMNDANHAAIQRGHQLFRAKWDNSLLLRSSQSAILHAARRHYRRRHAPFRDLKVAFRLLSGQGGTRRNVTNLKRGLQLIVSAARGFAGLPRREP